MALASRRLVGLALGAAALAAASPRVGAEGTSVSLSSRSGVLVTRDAGSSRFHLGVSHTGRIVGFQMHGQSLNPQLNYTGMANLSPVSKAYPPILVVRPDGRRAYVDRPVGPMVTEVQGSMGRLISTSTPAPWLDAVRGHAGPSSWTPPASVPAPSQGAPAPPAGMTSPAGGHAAPGPVGIVAVPEAFFRPTRPRTEGPAQSPALSGWELVVAGDLDQGLARLTAAAAESPRNGEVGAQLGLAQARAGRLGDAITTLRQALARDPYGLAEVRLDGDAQALGRALVGQVAPLADEGRGSRPAAFLLAVIEYARRDLDAAHQALIWSARPGGVRGASATLLKLVESARVDTPPPSSPSSLTE